MSYCNIRVYAPLCMLWMFSLPTLVVGQKDSIAVSLFSKCSVKLTGKVMDGETGYPLENASLQLKGISQVFYTDSKGLFEIAGICGNRYEVMCSRVGYKALTVKLELAHSKTWDFELHADHCELESVVVVGKKTAPIPTQSVVTLSGNSIDRVRGSALGEMLQQLPGVSVLQTGPTIFKPVIQGLYGQRVLIMNNGIRLESQQWGSEHAPEVDPYLANSLTVVKGASSVRYGPDAIGGVVLVDPKPLRKISGVGGELHLGGFSNSRGGVGSGILDFSSSKIPGLSARVQGTYRRLGAAKTPNYYLKNSALEEYNYSYTLGYNRKRFGAEVFYSQFNTRIGILSTAHIGNLTDLQRAIGSPEPLIQSGFSYSIDRPYQQVVHELFKASAYWKAIGGGKFSIAYALQYNKRQEFDRDKPLNDSLAALNRPELDLRISTNTLQAVYEHRRLGNLSGSVGVSGIEQGNIFKGRFFIPNFKSYAAGVFWIEQWQRNKWLVEAGLRYDYKWMQAYFIRNGVYNNPEFRFSSYSGSVGLAHQTTEHLSLRASVSSGFRPPHVSELFSNGLHHGAAAVERGDETLGQEQSVNYSVSAQVKSSKVISEISLYYTTIQNYTYLKPVFPATLTIRGAFPTFQYTQVNATFAGIDFYLSDTLTKHLSVMSKISLVHAQNKSANEPLIMTPPTRLEQGLVYTFSSRRKIVQPYLGLTNILVFRKERLPAMSDYLAAPNGYSLFSFHLGASLPFEKSRLELSASIINLLNTRYRDYLDRLRYFVDAPGRNGIVRVKFIF